MDRWAAVFERMRNAGDSIRDLWDVITQRRRHACLSTSFQADLPRLACRLPGLLLLAAVLACPTQSFGMEQSPYQVYIVSPAVNNYAILPDAPLPRVCALGQTMCQRRRENAVNQPV